MLAAPHRLRRSRDFTLTVRRGARAGRPDLVVHCLLTAVDEPARIGFTVGASVGGSVARHRVSRRLRALAMPLVPTLPAGASVVVRALPGASTCSHADLQDQMRGAVAAAVRKAAA
ncbi:MAG: ribonuclease P protein component [Candidatus Nanopelagicales bacterium]|nr:ribonuclease P protein component [Candidatus Nanopelagicales bacterium]